jgi:hypothetical protein
MRARPWLRQPGGAGAAFSPNSTMLQSVNTAFGQEPPREGGNRPLNEQRLGWYTIAIAISCVVIAMALWPILHSHQTGQHCFDFNWIWLTGKRAASNHAAEVYSPAARLPPDAAAMPEFQCGESSGNGRFDYPPTVLFFTYPLGFLPYYTAMAVWVTATLLLYLSAVFAILPRIAAIAAALTTYPVILNILIAHNGFLTAGLFGLALAFMERRPWSSGLFLGLLTYKPQFGILFPLALLASRNWRAFIGASVASIAFAGAAAVAFGFELWPLFLLGATEMASRLTEHHSLSDIIFPTIFGILRHFDVGIQTAWAVQGVVSAAAAFAICVLWSRPIPHALKAAAIAVASLVVTPYALTYDFCILSIAVAFLVKDGLGRGFLRGERTLIILCWGGLSLFAFVAAIFATGLTGSNGFGGQLLYFFLAAVPILICAAMFGQIVRRALWAGPGAVRPAAAIKEEIAEVSG